MIQIERIVKKVINSFIKENCYPVNEYYGRFNTKKEDSKLMPSNKYQVMVYSNDHNPPHFHVIDNNGWVVKFLIENGQLYDIEATGAKKSVLQYWNKNIPKWIKRPSNTDPSQTIKGRLIDLWNEMNPKLVIEKTDDCFINQQKQPTT